MAHTPHERIRRLELVWITGCLQKQRFPVIIGKGIDIGVPKKIVYLQTPMIVARLVPSVNHFAVKNTSRGQIVHQVVVIVVLQSEVSNRRSSNWVANSAEIKVELFGEVFDCSDVSRLNRHEQC